jgi:hypothetical protein
MIHLRHEIRLYSKLFGSVDVRCGTAKHSKIQLKTLGYVGALVNGLDPATLMRIDSLFSTDTLTIVTIARQPI